MYIDKRQSSLQGLNKGLGSCKGLSPKKGDINMWNKEKHWKHDVLKLHREYEKERQKSK